jgi:4,5-DOPA dioxygenase extradiol
MFVGQCHFWSVVQPIASYFKIVMNAPAIFLPHGGGPMPLLGDQSQKELSDFIRVKAKQWLGKVKAIVLVTAHWETSTPTVSGAGMPV